VVNDFQVAKYSGTTLFIYGVKVDGVEYMEFTGWPDEAIRLLFTNSFEDTRYHKDGGSEDGVILRPWEAIEITDDTQDLVFTLSVNVDGILVEAPEYEEGQEPQWTNPETGLALAPNWWEGISIATEVRPLR
jgi:hypothetical protein